MYYLDHDPPHVHAHCGGSNAVIRISPFDLMFGDLPPRALAMVREWATLHQNELEANWSRLRRGEPPIPIAPLE